MGCLLLSVVAAWVSRRARPGVAFGLAAAAVGAALPAWASWTGPPPTLRSALLAAPALAAAGLAQTVPRWSAGASGLGLLAWVFAATSVLVHVFAYDPFADLYCSRVCRSTAGPWFEGTAPEAVVAVEGLLVLGAVTAGLTGVAVGRSVPAMVRCAVGVSLVGVAAAVSADLVWRDSEAWARTTSVWLPWALGPTASAVCIFAVRAARMRRAIDSLLRDLETGQAGEVHFAVPGENRWVDEAGRDVPLESPAVVVLRDDHGPAVRLANTHVEQAVAALSPSRTLALSNARLTALAAARIADVRAAQRRTVQRADSERHRIERDLHDGAQQTLVSAAFHLSAVVTRNGSSREIEKAQAHVAAALTHLRDLVNGPVPEVLLDEGIRAALEDLAAEASSPVAVAVHGEQEPPTEVAIAAYLCVAALVGRACPEPCGVHLDIAEPGARLVVRSIGDLSNPVDQDLLDRVGALSGTVTCTRPAGEWSVEVWIPCGS